MRFIVEHEDGFIWLVYNHHVWPGIVSKALSRHVGMAAVTKEIADAVSEEREMNLLISSAHGTAAAGEAT